MMMLQRQLSAPHPMKLAGVRGRCELNDELRVKASELERRFADYKLRIGADRTGPTPRRGEIRGGTCADGDVTCGGEERRRRSNSRGELYGAYMERRDARLREGWRTRMEEKEAQMKAMWGSLERSRAEMAAMFGRSSRSHRVEKREISESSAEKKTHDLATPRSTPSKRFSFNSVASSSTPRSSITQVSRPSYSDSTKRMIQPESPLAQSGSTVSNPEKKNRTPSTGNITANSMPRSRILTRSTSSISNAEGRMAPRSVSSRSEMKRGTKSTKPFLRRGSGIGAGAGAAVAKQRACNVFETTANGEETTEMVDQRDILSDGEKDNNEDCPRLSGNDPDGRNSSLSQESYNDVEPVSGNGKANGNKVEELSGESSRSWYSNMSSSFSNKSGIDNLSDSPVGSPPALISQSVEQLREAELTRGRKKWEAAEKQIVASSNPQSPKDVARGLKRFLNFGRKSKGSEGLASECASALVNSHADEDIEYEPNTVENCLLNDLSKSKDGASASGFNDQRTGHTNSLEVLSLHSSIPTLAANFDQKEDHSFGKSPKAHRSFFSFPSLRSKGSETKLKC